MKQDTHIEHISVRLNRCVNYELRIEQVTANKRDFSVEIAINKRL